MGTAIIKPVTDFDFEVEVEGLIRQWEPHNSEVVRVIDNNEDTVERIIKVHDVLSGRDSYSLFRYFRLGNSVTCSVDLDTVSADKVIQHLGEQL